MSKATDRLRKAIADYHQARAVTRQGTVGRPDLVREVAARRDDDLELKAASEFRAFLQAALGHDPAPEEIETGTGLVAADRSSSPIVLGGARSLSTLFEFLAMKERDIQKELGILAPGLGTVALRWGPPVIALAGLATLGGYLLIKRRRPPMPGQEGAPDDEGSDEEEEDNEPTQDES